MDGVEIFLPYLAQFGLAQKYRNLWLGDVREFEFCYYDIILAGDIIEHMSVADAQKTIGLAKQNCKMLLVAVPFKLPQGEWYGNKFEIHIQDDLTEDLFNERYPGFEKKFSNELGWYGVFVYHAPQFQETHPISS